MKAFQSVLLLLGLIVLGATLYKYVESLGYKYWLSTPGYLEPGFFRDHRASIKRGSKPMKVGTARYTYEVSGVRYVGSDIVPLGFVYLPEDVVNKLKPGEITVFYKLNKPSKSYIFTETPVIQMILLSSLGMLLVILAIFAPAGIRYIVRIIRDST